MSKEEEKLEKTTETIVRAAVDFAVSENQEITNMELASILREVLMMSDGVLSSKVEVVQETEEERTVREVMEAPESFTVHVQMVLSGDMSVIRSSYSLVEERVSAETVPDDY